MEGAAAPRRVFSLVMLLMIMMAAFPPRPHAADFTDFVAQSLCLDERGRPVDLLPVEEACLRRRPQHADDPAIYRKHDWPNRLDEPATTLGYQASDSVVDRRGGQTIIVQTFDFGTAGRTFGRFDAGRGDGGQVLLFTGPWASFAMTEDGGGGVQWFIGQACQKSTDPDARFPGWPVFRSDVDRQGWRSDLSRLNITAGPTVCPNTFNAAYTRFRLTSIALPFRFVESLAPIRTAALPVEVIVSEHFAGDAIRTADHLERFYLAKGLGLIRWERWANGNVRAEPTAVAASKMLATTARCPSLSEYGPPASGWLLVDCRMWTTLARPLSAWSVRDFKWPALNAFGGID